MVRDEFGFIKLTPKKNSVHQLVNKNKEKQLIFRHGHIAITNYKLGDNPEFEKSLSVFDEIYWKYRPVGYYYVAPLKELRINRGYDITLLRKFFPKHKPIVDNHAFEYKECKIRLKAEPRDDFQRTAFTFMAGEGPYKSNRNFTQVMIDAAPGEGKAMPDDTLILTPSGWRRLGELEIGDKVYNRNMKPVDILAIYPQKGRQNTYQVVFEDGRVTRCNIEHLWEVYDENGNCAVMPLYHIMNDFSDKSFFVKMAEPDTDAAIPDDLEDCAVYGILEAVRDHAISHIRFSIKAEDAFRVVQYIRSQKYLCWLETTSKTGFVSITLKESKTGMMHLCFIDQVASTMQRCILIDDPDHIYIAENYIPTHNTYCGSAMTCYWGARAIIVVPFTKLLNQWKQSYLQFTDLKEDEILIVQGSKICKKIIEGKFHHVKIFIFMVDTIASFEDQYGPLKTIDLLESTRAYMKIVDEVHLDIKAIAMIEALSNFRMNYYLSASPGRTSSKENWIFSRLFLNVPRFGSNFKKQEEKHLNIIIKYYNFLPDQQQLRSVINPRKKWLNTKAYETALFNASKSQKQSFETSLLQILQWIKEQLGEKNKVLILCNTIEGTTYLKEVAEQVFSGECSQYYGTMPSKEEKEKALKSRIICATSSSLGTGADIKHLQFCINTCTYSSKIEAIQVSGRLRRLEDAQVAYIELVNSGWYKTLKQYEKRKPTLISRSRSGKLIIIE